MPSRKPAKRTPPAYQHLDAAVVEQMKAERARVDAAPVIDEQLIAAWEADHYGHFLNREAAEQDTTLEDDERAERIATAEASMATIEAAITDATKLTDRPDVGDVP